MSTQSATGNFPLVVDLDGTLCRTDTLHEGILDMAASDPFSLLKVPGWLARGRVELKAALADRKTIDAASLPLNEEVLDLVRQAREDGRRTALVSASDHRQVTAVADETGLFDEAYGSAEGRNLKGEEKAAFLREHYGAGQYDYVGDSKADLAVWKDARTAITVGAGGAMRRAAQAANSNVQHISDPKPIWPAIIKAMRPHQWSKNALIFLPVLAAHDPSVLWLAFLALISFSLTASSVYVINDLVDLAADRAHPRKRLRPFASGSLTAVQGVVLAATLLITAVLVGFATGRMAFLAVLAFYFFCTLIYSLWLKRKLIIDVLMLGGLYTLRILAGGAATNIDLSPWMLGFSIFVFLALAAVKRQAELVDQQKSGRSSAGRAYTPDDLPVIRGLALSSGQAAVLVLALYINSPEVKVLYNFPSLIWFVCPLVLYWVTRMVMKTHRGLMTDDPIVFAATDRVSIAVVATSLAIGVAAAIWPWHVPTI